MKMFANRLNYFVCSIILFVSALNAAVINKEVERNIDLRTHLVKINYRIGLDGYDKRTEKYIFALPKEECARLSYISATDEKERELDISEPKADSCEYGISIKSPTATPTIYITTVYSKSLEAHPKEIQQFEKQFVKFNGNGYFYSPYKTLKQKTGIQLPSTNLLSHTELQPVTVQSDLIKYGPYENVAELSFAPIQVHFENHSPFLTITHMERSIEVSHWGNIAVEEKINLEHTGAKLKGPFSRYELQKDSRVGQPAVKSIKTLLPAAAKGVYYRDSNGNISTSNMKVLFDRVELELKPRFTLFGGWKTSYILGYSVPSFEYLFNNGDAYKLKMRIIDHVYDEMVVDELYVKIILPEGSNQIKLTTPYAITRDADSLHYTYLDTVGRPVVQFSKKNLVENHINDFELEYNFNQVNMLLEPLLLICFIFLLFLGIIIFTRLDFSIAPAEKPHAHKE